MEGERLVLVSTNRELLFSLYKTARKGVHACGGCYLGLRRVVGPSSVCQASPVAILDVEVQLEQLHQTVNNVCCLLPRLIERGREDRVKKRRVFVECSWRVRWLWGSMSKVLPFGVCRQAG